MQILGKLRDDIQRGNAVLFLGAGTGIAAGLLGAEALAERLYNLAGLKKLEGRARDLSRLVAALDREPQYTRAWTGERRLKIPTDDN
jgi:hypothetical protein